MSIYTMTPSKVRASVIRCLDKGLVPFIQSSPGMGKSAIVKQIAKDFKLKLIDVRLSTLEPVDLSGLPTFDMDGKAVFHPYDMFPLEGETPPAGMNGWLLFLDEFNSASRAVQAASYRLVLDHEVGMRKLSKDCYVVCAGNKTTDNAIVTKLSTAMLSRVIHLNMEISFEDWMNAVAIPEDYDERIIAYLNMYPEKLMQFDPEREEQTFCCPRTWEFTNKLIKDKPLTNEDIPLLSGTITPDIATEFVQFARVYKKLVSIDTVVKTAGNAPVPADTATRYAVISHLMTKVTEKELEPVVKYVDKFDSSFKLLFYKYILKKNKDFLKNSFVRENVMKEAEYLLGDN